MLRMILVVVLLSCGVVFHAAAAGAADPAGPPVVMPHAGPGFATADTAVAHTDTAAAHARETQPLGRPAAAASQPASRQPADSLGISRTILALGLVLGLAVAAGAVVRRVAKSQGGLASMIGAAGAAPSGVLEIIGRYPIARGQRLVLLRVDRRILLLSHVAPSRLSRGGGFTTLCEIADPDDVASLLTKARDAEGESLAAKFTSMLSRYAGRGEDEDPDDDPTHPPHGRRIHIAAEGDRAELWDDGRREHHSVGAGRAPELNLVGQAAPASREAEPAGRSEDAVSAIRRRLEAMRLASAGNAATGGSA